MFRLRACVRCPPAGAYMRAPHGHSCPFRHGSGLPRHATERTRARVRPLAQRPYGPAPEAEDTRELTASII
jgi:hypothetical protein